VDRCAICHNELAAQWKYCVHCGTPVPARPSSADGWGPAADWDAQLDAIPSAIRPEPAPSESGRRFDVRLAVGIAMAAVGILVVIYAVANLLAARG